MLIQLCSWLKDAYYESKVILSLIKIVSRERCVTRKGKNGCALSASVFLERLTQQEFESDPNMNYIYISFFDTPKEYFIVNPKNGQKIERNSTN